MSATRPLAVLFDLDGTLIDTIELLLGCMQHAFAEHEGRKPTTEEWIAGIGIPLESQMEPFTRSAEERRSLVQRYRTYQREHHDRLTTCYAGTVETVEALHRRGHPMGIVTSKGNELMDRGLAYVGLAPFMGVTIGSDSCTIHKPEPYPVQLALERLGYEPADALFVGDSPHDMTAGRRAGVVTVAALWGPFARPALEPTYPAHYLNDIRELPALVQQLRP